MGTQNKQLLLLIIHGEGGWNHNFCSANSALVAGYGDENFGTINSNIAALLQRLRVHKSKPTKEHGGFWLIQ